MATRPANVKVYSSAIPVSVWSGLALVAIAAAIMWAVPQARWLVGVGMVAGGILAAVMVAMRRKSGSKPDESAAPLHLRD
jgi:hypothetical protein